jgi:hypothetical protein
MWLKNFLSSLLWRRAMQSLSVLLSSKGDKDSTGDVRGDSVYPIVNKATISTFDRNLETVESTTF